MTPEPTHPERQPPAGDGRTALGKEALINAFLGDLFYVQGEFPALATKNDYYMALSYAVRDRMRQRWISTAAEYTTRGSRTVSYLSAEFLTGPRGQILGGPVDPRVWRRHLARAARADPADHAPRRPQRLQAVSLSARKRSVLRSGSAAPHNS